ncbi:MAG: pyruvate kinase [Lachnospiraceae bacterium]|nr:pyruvate kinase [Lachnospiraceae bacterium]
MKKTKIVCTMGPNTNDRRILTELVKNGMNVARFNFSHGSHEEHRERMELLCSVRDELHIPVAAMLDTKGPEIRTGDLKGDKPYLKDGELFTLTIRPDVLTDETIASITYPGLVKDVEIGTRILIDDGLIELKVESKTDTDIVCRVLNGGELGAKKGVNVPNVKIKLPGITERDKRDILFGIDEGFDFVAASFVRNAACIQEIRNILNAHGSTMRIIAKIENAEGIDNIDEIIAAADGIMVARGDMGVEIPAENVPHIQKWIIQKCNAAQKPVITATQMLDSMIRNPRPTRAEVTDVANAIYDGTDAIMLSGETAMGKYPVEALKMMVHIAESSEPYLNYGAYTEKNIEAYDRVISNALSRATVWTADALRAKAIIAPTMHGFTANLISNWRPRCLILGMSPNKDVLRKMQLNWGVEPVVSVREFSTDELIEHSVEIAKNKGYVQSGDKVVVTVGVRQKHQPANSLGETNNLRVIDVN